mgnify:CR=1 FL=1
MEERNAFLFVNKDKRGIYSKIMVDDVEIHTVNAEKKGEIAERAADYLTSGDEFVFEDIVPTLDKWLAQYLSLIHISEPTRPPLLSRMPSSA